MSKEKLLESHGGLLFDLDAKEPIMLEESIAILKEHKYYHSSILSGSENKILYHKQISDSIGVVLTELERVTTRLGESLPNGGFCVKGCKNSMKPTLVNDKE
jgi:hypothetical protein